VQLAGDALHAVALVEQLGDGGAMAARWRRASARGPSGIRKVSPPSRRPMSRAASSPTALTTWDSPVGSQAM
jgi:hypothetical protein